MTNTAFVLGLGGTGVSTIIQVKSQLLTREGQLPLNVSLLGIDTDPVLSQATTDESLPRAALDPDEYLGLGGDLYELAQEVSRGLHPHIGAWFQAETWLASLPRDAFILQRGSGHLRQFGRLALFHDLAAPSLSHVYSQIDKRIWEVISSGTSLQLDVCLVAGLGGGSGAGMLVDIAHLVREIAQTNHQINPTITAFLILPDAYLGLPGAVSSEMHASAYAAVRELESLNLTSVSPSGYSIQYRLGSSDSRIWRGRLNCPPFDLVYYLDGHRKVNPLTHVRPSYGVLPTIADMISTIVTDTRKVHDQRLQRISRIPWSDSPSLGRRLPQAAGLGGALGTYAIVLPMNLICELLSYRFALDTLRHIAGPVSADLAGIPIELSADANQQAGHGISGQQRAVDFLQHDEVRSVRDDRTIPSTNFLWGLLEVYSESNVNGMDRSIERLALDQNYCRYHLVPQGDWSEAVELRQSLRRDLDLRLEDQIPPRVAGERPEDAIVRIQHTLRYFKREQLGIEGVADEKPQNGRIQRAFSVAAEWHVRHFKATLALETLNILNGAPTLDPVVQQGGKPSYYLDFLTAVREILDHYVTAVTLALNSEQRRIMGLDLIRYADQTRDAMRARPGGLFWRGRPQQEYLKAEQRLVDFLGAKLALEAAQQAAVQMRQQVESLIAAMREWCEVLFTGKTSMISALLSRLQAIEAEIKKEQVTPVREIINDRDYLDQLYQKYGWGLRDARADILSDLEWRYEFQDTEGMSRDNPLKLVIRESSPHEAMTMLGASREASPERDLDLLVKRCRRVFAEAYNTESILSYLMDRYPDPDMLASRLLQNSEPALASELVPGGDNGPWLSISLAVASPREAEESAYLNTIQHKLSQEARIDLQWLDVCDCEDRFRLQIVQTLDLLPVDAITSIQKAQADYMAYGTSSSRSGQALGRPSIHIFPMTVNAARFEDRLAEIGETPHQFCENVTVLMEDVQTFQLFVRAWSLGIIGDQTEQMNSQELHYYCLKLDADGLQSEPPKAAQYEPFQLSRPAETPDLFAALLTFIHDRREVRDVLARPINYGRINQQCDRRRDQLGGAQANAAHLRNFLETVVAPLRQDPLPHIRDVASVLHLLANDELRELLALGQRGLEFFRVWDGSEGLNFGQLARAFSERLADECKLDLISFSMESEGLYVATFETSQLLQHTPGIAKRIPMLLARMAGDVGPNVERLREILMRVTHAAQRIALVVLPVSADALPAWREAIYAQIQAIDAIDVIVPSREEIRGVFAAKLPPAALRRLIFSQVNLEAVSPFKISGAVPDTMFFGRELELRTITEHIGDVSYALIGGRRIGKTSILHRLHRVRLPAQGFRSYFHEASSTPTRDDFLRAAARVWLEDSSVAPRSFTELLDRLPHDRPLVFLIDEADKLVPEDAVAMPHRFPLFAELRSLAQSGQCQFVIAGERILRETMLGDSTGPLYNFATEILVGRLQLSDVRELIMRPFHQLEIDLPDEEGVVRRVFEITAGHPNIVQRLCHRLIRRLNQRKSRTLDVNDVEAIFADPDFVRKDFLTTYWEQATLLERLASLLLVRDNAVSTLEDVTAALAQEGIQADLNAVDAALERLVDLRNILHRAANGYAFAVPSFNDLVKQPQWLGSYINRYRDTYQHRGDVVPFETTLGFGG